MTKAYRLAVTLAAMVLATVTGSTSDIVAVYGKIERVRLEPASGAPVTAQVWGVFSVAVRGNPNDYQPARRGYLYYHAGSDVATARTEWADLQRVAGTGQIVAFGSRFESIPTVRVETAPPDKSDPYTLNAGLVKVNGRTDYAPIRGLLDFKP